MALKSRGVIWKFAARASFWEPRQSGAAMLRFADLEQDMALLEWARELAPQMLQQYPRQAQQHIERWLGSKAEYLKA